MKPKLFERNKARKLRTKGFGVKEIAKELKVSKSSVSVWVRDVPLGELQKQRLIQRELWGEAKGRKKIIQQWRDYRLLHPKPIKKPQPIRAVETFFDTWTVDMAYVLGYFAADGHMYKNRNGSRYMAFTSTDKELLVSIKEILRVTNAIEGYLYSREARKTKYILQIGSKIIYDKLLKFGFTPNKSLTLNFPNIPNQFLGYFLRGYFDGDGCAGFYKIQRKDRKSKYLLLTIQLRCGSKKFLEVMKQKVADLKNIAHGVLAFHGGAYSLAYTGPSVVKLYRFLYPKLTLPCLERKRLVLKGGILEKYGIEV